MSTCNWIFLASDSHLYDSLNRLVLEIPFHPLLIEKNNIKCKTQQWNVKHFKEKFLVHIIVICSKKLKSFRYIEEKISLF